MSDHLIYESLEQKRFDPFTKKTHWVVNEAITDEVMLKRMLHRPEDQHPQIKKKLLEYRAFKQLIDQEYSQQLIRINAEQDAPTIFKNLTQAVEYSF